MIAHPLPVEKLSRLTDQELQTVALAMRSLFVDEEFWAYLAFVASLILAEKEVPGATNE